LKNEKVTVGITALSFLRDQIERKVCDLDVGLEFPKGVEALMGGTVRPLKFYMI